MDAVGRSLVRKEDTRFLIGSGSFIGDFVLPGMCEAVFLRSSVAHGRIVEVDPSCAITADGVVAVLTASDLHRNVAALTRPFYTLDPDFAAYASVTSASYNEPLLAANRVVRSGDPLALVVAADRCAAEDARDLIAVDIDPWDVVSDPEAAMAPSSPRVHPDIPHNIHTSFRVVVGDPSRAMRGLRRVSARFRIGRSIGSPLENRGVVACWDAGDDHLTVWSTTQVPHVLRSYLTNMLRLAEGQIRVVAPDMGGSFGGGIYPDEILIPYAAMRLGVPIRWLEDRTEDLAGSRHSRDQIIDAELSFDDDGKLHVLKMRILQDSGAHNPFGLTLTYNAAAHARSTYRIDHFIAEGICVLTNKTRNTPVRGAGRPEATFVIDRLIDMAAVELGMDPAQMRRINLIPGDAMPYDMGMLYRDGAPMVYDSGDFPDQFAAALDAAGYEDLRQRQRQARARGRYLGVGISCHVEGTGLGPHEGSCVHLLTDGNVEVHSGAQPHGQSLETTLAQVSADVLTVDVGLVTVRAGDTSLTRTGGGTFGSRSAVTAGTSVREASRALRTEILSFAAGLFGVGVDDVEFARGRVSLRGGSDTLELSVLAEEASNQGVELKGEAEWTPPTVTFGSGTAVALVEVDPETGIVDVLEYTIVDDCGTILNPAVVDGQLHGGVAHGIGNALLEEARYDEDGQLLTATFMDYLLPTAADVPVVRLEHRSHPTPLNPLGVKGVGEGATSSAPAAVVNAICDALKDFGVQATEFPLTPSRIVELVALAIAEGHRNE